MNKIRQITWHVPCNISHEPILCTIPHPPNFRSLSNIESILCERIDVKVKYIIPFRCQFHSSCLCSVKRQAIHEWKHNIRRTIHVRSFRLCNIYKRLLTRPIHFHKFELCTHCDMFHAPNSAHNLWPKSRTWFCNNIFCKVIKLIYLLKLTKCKHVWVYTTHYR